MRKHRIHPDQIELYCKTPRTSKDVSDHFGISVVYAQQMLKSLKDQNRIGAISARDKHGHKMNHEFVTVYAPPAHDPFNLAGLSQ